MVIAAKIHGNPCFGESKSYACPIFRQSESPKTQYANFTQSIKFTYFASGYPQKNFNFSLQTTSLFSQIQSERL